MIEKCEFCGTLVASPCDTAPPDYCEKAVGSVLNKYRASGYQCADCKAPLRSGYTCDACGSAAAEEIEA